MEGWWGGTEGKGQKGKRGVFSAAARAWIRGWRKPVVGGGGGGVVQPCLPTIGLGDSCQRSVRQTLSQRKLRGSGGQAKPARSNRLLAR